MNKKMKTGLLNELKNQLAVDGYAVIPNYVDEENCELINTYFWDYMETLNPLLKREDKTTWTTLNLPANTRGLIQHYNCGFQKHAVHARKLLAPLFEHLHGTDKLVSSFDGTSFSRKPKNHKYKDLEDWSIRGWETDAFHIDQTTEGFKCVQAGLAVIEQDEDSHVFICVPGSHLYHEEIMKLNGGFKKGDWLVMNDETKAFLKSKNLELKRIALEKGSVVCWDSRTAHSSSGYCKTSNPETTRLQVFVCMAPASNDKQIFNLEFEKRNKGYEEGRVSRHNPITVSLFPKNPRLYAPAQMKFNIPKSIELDEEEKKLHGLLSYY